MTRPAPLDDPAIRRTMHSADVAHIAVQTPSGPHVTPLAYTFADGRLWLLTPSDSLKARMLQRDPRVGILLGAADEWVMANGVAELLSPVDVRDYLRAAQDLKGLATGVGSYLVRNRSRIVGFAADLATGDGDHRCRERVLLRIRPTSIRTVPVPTPVDRRRVRRRRSDLSVIDTAPDTIRQLAGKTRSITLGWDGTDGPLVVPAVWDAHRGVALAHRHSLPMDTHAHRSRACLTFDEADGRRPSRTRGLVIRGSATAHVIDDVVEVTVSGERITWWDGYHAAALQPIEAAS